MLKTQVFFLTLCNPANILAQKAENYRKAAGFKSKEEILQFVSIHQNMVWILFYFKSVYKFSGRFRNIKCCGQ